MNMKDEYKKLGEIATYINGYAFKPEDRGNIGLPIIRIQDLTGNAYDLGYYKGEYPKKIEINNGDVLISWSASLGVYVWNKGKALLNQHIFKVVFDKTEIDKDYFVYAVKYKLQEMASKTHGATMKHIIKKDFDNTLIPFPPLCKQNAIADILGRVERLIKIRNDELASLDNLIKARFVEMFGDPVSNSLNQPILAMTDVCEIIDGDRGVNYPKQEDFYNDEYCLFLNAKNVTKKGFDFSECMFITKEKDEQLRKGKLKRGDVVLTTRGTLGNIAFYTKDIPFDNVRINSGMVILRLNRDIIDETFFIEQFRMQVDSIKTFVASGSAQPQLPISTMNKIKVLMPDLELQKQYSQIIEQIDKSKFIYSLIT